jgi:hypothetical protein
VRPPQLPPDDGTRRVLADPDAQVDREHSALDGRGDLLAVLVVPDRSFGAVDDRCHTSSPSVFRWVGRGGRSLTWSDQAVNRSVLGMPDGFVVGAIRPGCARGTPGERGAYVVDDRGRQRTVQWASPADRSRCAVVPGRPDCEVSVADATGRVVVRPRPPAGSTPLGPVDGEVRWARSADGRTIWSDDGSGWQRHDTTLGPSTYVVPTAAGRRAAFTAGTVVEATDDAGRSWRTRDLAGALRSLRVADVDWTLLPSGTLLGVTRLVGVGDVTFRSTDHAWTSFRKVDVHTSLGAVTPEVVGSVVTVPDQDAWLVSGDDGRTWRRVSPLG